MADGVRREAGRVARHLKRRQHVDAYVVAFVAMVLAVLTLLGKGDDDLRWSAVLAALAILVYRITLPEARGDVDAVLQSRVAFNDTTFASRLRSARTLWVFGPSAINVLGGSTGNELRRTILARADGMVRVAVLDPDAPEAVALAARQLDEALDYPMKSLAASLADAVLQLDTIAAWDTPGSFEYRFAGFNPGFSLIGIDPESRDGVLIVEFHGYHNESTESRMHVELTRRASQHWYDYWLDQFQSLWNAAREPVREG